MSSNPQNPSVNLLRSLYEKRVRFWYEDLISGHYESTGIVVEYIVEENCLTVRDDRSGFKHYVGVDQVELIEEG